MKISDLIKNLTENLNDEQKAMSADVLIDGSTYEIDTILITAVGEGVIAEGQPIMASFGALNDTDK